MQVNQCVKTKKSVYFLLTTASRLILSWILDKKCLTVNDLAKCDSLFFMIYLCLDKKAGSSSKTSKNLQNLRKTTGKTVL